MMMAAELFTYVKCSKAKPIQKLKEENVFNQRYFEQHSSVVELI